MLTPKHTHLLAVSTQKIILAMKRACLSCYSPFNKHIPGFKFIQSSGKFYDFDSIRVLLKFCPLKIL